MPTTDHERGVTEKWLQKQESPVSELSQKIIMNIQNKMMALGMGSENSEHFRMKKNCLQ